MVTRAGSGFVYFIATATPRGRKVKIGYATNVNKRRRALQTASPVKLEVLMTIPGDMADEKLLHKQFAAHRMEGEWFRWCREISDYINDAWDLTPSGRDEQNPWDYT